MAKNKYFKVVGIKPPGRVDLFKRGEVRLHELDDETLYEIYKEGKCPFVKMTKEGFKHYYPSKKTISTTSTSEKTAKKPAQSGSSAKKTTTKKTTGKESKNEQSK
ncbi:MAG: hypothetical protein ACQER7_06270 [Bacteroidota bacterium]